MGTDTVNTASEPDRMANEAAALVGQLVEVENKVDLVGKLFGAPVAATLRPDVEAAYEAAVDLRSGAYWAQQDRDGERVQHRARVVAAENAAWLLADELDRRAKRSGKPLTGEVKDAVEWAMGRA